jgi:hypothetical protein
MEKRVVAAVLCCLAFLCFWEPATGLLSAKGINYEGNWSSFSSFEAWMFA